jgi:hypothetical protein
LVDCIPEHDIPEEFCFADQLVADERSADCHSGFDEAPNSGSRLNAVFLLQEILCVNADSVVLYILPEQDFLALC